MEKRNKIRITSGLGWSSMKLDFESLDLN